MERNGTNVITLDEFEALDFGDQRAQLVKGRIVIENGSLSDEEGILTATLAELIGTRLRCCPGAACRPAVSPGLRIRSLESGHGRDSFLTPALAIQCHSGNGGWTPTAVVEIVSGAERLDDTLDKIDVYTAIPTVRDILALSAEEMAASHYHRDHGVWLDADHLTRPTDVIAFEKWSFELMLSILYQDLTA